MLRFNLDLVTNVPRLSWVNLKVKSRSDFGKKNVSGHSPEHVQALKDNAQFEIEKANTTVINNLKNEEEMREDSL